jgi:hypothetical protein
MGLRGNLFRALARDAALFDRTPGAQFKLPKRSRHRLREETGKACRLSADLVTLVLYVESQAENRLSLLLAFPSSQDVFNLQAI